MVKYKLILNTTLCKCDLLGFSTDLVVCVWLQASRVTTVYRFPYSGNWFSSNRACFSLEHDSGSREIAKTKALEMSTRDLKNKG